MKVAVFLILHFLAYSPPVRSTETSPTSLSSEINTVRNRKDLQRLNGKNAVVIGIYMPYSLALPNIAARMEREFAEANPPNGHISMSRTTDGIPQEWAGILLEDGGFISLFPANHYDAKRSKYELEDFSMASVKASGGVSVGPGAGVKGVLADGHLFLNRLEPALARTASTAQQSIYQKLVNTGRLGRWQYISALLPEQVKALQKEFITAPPTVPGKEDAQRPAKSFLDFWGQGRDYEILMSPAAGVPTPSPPAKLELTLIRSLADDQESGDVASFPHYLRAIRLSYTAEGASAGKAETYPPAFYEVLNILSDACFNAGPAVLASMESRVKVVPKGSIRRLFTPSLEAVVTTNASGSISVILSRLGALGTDGWKSYCDFEPRTLSFRPRALWKMP